MSLELDFLMIVERILPAACERLITIGDDAPLIAAAALLSDLIEILSLYAIQMGCWLVSLLSRTLSARSVIAKEPAVWPLHRTL